MISPTTMVMTRTNHSGDLRWAQNRLPRSFQKQPQRNHGRSAGPHPYWVIRLNCPADATELRDRFRIWPRSA